MSKQKVYTEVLCRNKLQLPIVFEEHPSPYDGGIDQNRPDILPVSWINYYISFDPVFTSDKDDTCPALLVLPLIVILPTLSSLGPMLQEAP